MLLLLPRQVRVRLVFKERSENTINGKQTLTISELSSFLYDFDLLYDCVALAALPEYKDYAFSDFFWYRKGKPLKEEHRLYLGKINHNSPLALEVIIPLTVGVLTVPWLFIQAIEKIRNWSLSREKLELEVEKLRLENESKRMENHQQRSQLDKILYEQHAMQTFERIIQRLEGSSLDATDIEVFYEFNDDTKR